MSPRTPWYDAPARAPLWVAAGLTGLVAFLGGLVPAAAEPGDGPARSGPTLVVVQPAAGRLGEPEPGTAASWPIEAFGPSDLEAMAMGGSKRPLRVLAGRGKRGARSSKGGSSRRQGARATGAQRPGGKPAPTPGPVLKPSTGDPPPFQFKSVVDVPFAATLQLSGGQALPLALVSVVASLSPPAPGQPIEELTSSDVFFDGFTDGQGQVDATLAIPASIGLVDVVVLAAGHRGAYTHEELRDLWGPFAPASRITVPVNALASLTLQLEEL